MRRAWGYLVGSSSTEKKDDNTEHLVEDEETSSCEEHEHNLSNIYEEDKESTALGKEEDGLFPSEEPAEKEVERKVDLPESVPNSEEINEKGDNDDNSSNIDVQSAANVADNEKKQDAPTDSVQAHDPIKEGDKNEEKSSVKVDENQDTTPDKIERTVGDTNDQQLDFKKDNDIGKEKDEQGYIEAVDKKHEEVEESSIVIDEDSGAIDRCKENEEKSSAKYDTNNDIENIEDTDQALADSNEEEGVNFISECEDEEWDEDDPFGFEADRDQEALLEAFRLGYDDDEDKLQLEQKEKSIRLADSPLNRISSSVYATQFDNATSESEETHPNQALFDIIDRNFDDLDSFHVPSLNRLITSDEIKLFFVAFVVVFTPPKPFEFARKYNHDVAVEEIMNPIDNPKENGEKRRGWLFRRNRSRANLDEDHGSDDFDNTNEDEVPSRNNKVEDDRTFVHIPYQVVFALWVEVAKGLGVIKNIDTEIESMKLIMTHVQESLTEMGLLEIDVQKRLLNLCQMEENASGHESCSVSIDSDKSENSSKDCTLYMIRHAINEKYGLYLAKYGDANIIENVAQLKKGWFEAVANVHYDISGPIDEYQRLMLPWLCLKGNHLSSAKDALTSETFRANRFETMGILKSVTLHLTDINALVRCTEANGEIPPDVEKFCISVCSELGSEIKAIVDESESEDNEFKPTKTAEINAIIESGKAFHLIALLCGSLGFMTEELEYHVESIKLKELWVQSSNDNAVATLSLSDSYNCMGVAYDNIGDFDEAITCYDRALTTRRTLLGNNHLKVAETCQTMGSLLCEHNEFDSGYLLLEEALRIRKNHLSERDELVAETEQWLGNLMRETGQLDEALDYFKSALVSKKVKVGDDHEDVADAMHNIAIILDDMQKQELSISCYEEALRIRELVCGRENLMVADTLLCLGNAYKSIKKRKKAISHIKDSIQIREKLLSPCGDLDDNSLIICMEDLSDDLLRHHKGLIDCYMELLPLIATGDTKINYEDEQLESKMETSDCLQQIGDIYSTMRCWDEAYERYGATLALRKEFDPELELKIGLTCIRRDEFEIGRDKLHDATEAIKLHPSNKSIVHHSLLYTLGVAYCNLQQYELAICSFNESLSILTYCPRPTYEGNVHYWIGRCYYETQEYSKATKSILSSLKIYNENRMDVKEQIIYRTLHLLGNTHFKNKQIKLALKCYQEEISLFESSVSRITVNDDCLSEAYYCAGIIHAKKGSFEDASEHLEAALETRKRFQGEENKKVAKILHKLGSIYLEMKKYDSAKEKLIDAYHILYKIQGPNDENTAAVQFKLGRVLDCLNELDLAMGHYSQCLEVRQCLENIQEEEVAIVLFYMGKNASLRRRFDNAIEYLEKALDIRRKVYSINHELIAVVLFELGRSYNNQKSIDKSLLCYREALRIWKLSSDKSHASQASFAIAQIFEGDNKIHPAIKNYIECISLTPNTEYSRIYIVHCRLGNLYEQNDELEKSAFHYEKSRENIGDVSADDEKLVDTLQSLSQVYSKMKRYDDALQCNKNLVSLQSDSSSLAGVFHSMGNIYFQLGQHGDALEYLKKSLSIHKTTRDPDDLSIAKTLMNLAKVNEAMEDPTEANDNLIEALRIFKLKHETKFTVEALGALAKINKSVKQLDEAKECFEECIALKTEYLGDQQLSLASTLHELGCLNMEMDDFSGSLEVFKSALKIRKQDLGLNHEDTTSTIMKIGEIYFFQEQYDASLRCFDQVLPYLEKLEKNENVDQFICHCFIGTIHFKETRFSLAVMSLKQAVQYKDCNIPIGIAIHDILHYLGSALQVLNRHTEAIEYLKKAAQERKNKIGANSKELAESIAALGECFYETKHYDDAVTQSTKALDVLKEINCKEDLLFAQTQICLAKILTVKDRHEDAIKLFDSSLELYEDAPRNCEEEIATVYLLKGKIYSKQRGQFNQAIEQFQKSLELRKKLSCDNETEPVAEVLMEVGVVLLENKELTSSLNCFLEALKIRKQIHQEGRLVAIAAYRAGTVLRCLRRFGEAMSFYEVARNNYKNIDGNNSTDVGKIDFGVGLVHKECNRFDEALKMFEKAIATLKDQDDEDCFAQCHFHVALLLSEKNDDRRKSMNSLFEALELLRGNYEKNKVKIADVLMRLGNIHQQSAKGREAMPLYLEAAQIYENKHRQVDHAYCLHQIGNIYMKSDKLDKSFPFYQKALILHKEHPHNEEAFASILYGIGFIYNQRFQHEEAMGVLKDSLKIRLQLLGKSSLEVAKTCEQLGTALVSLTRYEDALKVCTTALDIYRNELGENHICCARVMLDIGTIYCNKENYDLSLVQLQACLEFFKKECGEASEEVANVLLRIGQIHDLRVDHDEAMKCMTHALEIRSEMYGRNDVRVAETMLNIARVLQDWGDVDEAMDCFKNALKIYQLSKEDCLSAEVYNEIGSMYSERNEHEKALNAHNKSLSIFKKKVGNNSTEVGNTLRNIGAVYDALNDVSRSFKFYSDSLKILSHNLGKEDLGVSLVLNNLGINLARRNEYSKALEFCKEALLIRRKLLPDGHLDIADTLFNIANILDDKGDQDEQAMKFYTEALSKYRKNFGDDNEDVANCNKNIGLIHMRQGDSVNALKKISEALRIFRLKHGDDNAEVASLLYSLGRLFGKQAKYDKALACFSECLKIRNDLLGEEHKESIATKRFVVAIQRKMNGGR